MKTNFHFREKETFILLNELSHEFLNHSSAKKLLKLKKLPFLPANILEMIDTKQTD